MNETDAASVDKLLALCDAYDESAQAGAGHVDAFLRRLTGAEFKAIAVCMCTAIPEQSVRRVRRQVLGLLVRFGDDATDHPITHGSTRIVVIGPDHVYKVAFTDEGEQVNALEARGIDSVPLAAATMLTIDGAPVLRMQRVTPLEHDEAMKRSVTHPWVRRTDMRQVGLTADGQLVCYDAGQCGDYNQDYQH